MEVEREEGGGGKGARLCARLREGRGRGRAEAERYLVVFALYFYFLPLSHLLAEFEMYISCIMICFLGFGSEISKFIVSRLNLNCTPGTLPKPYRTSHVKVM